MKRREFIAGLGGAVAWPLAARAQQPSRSTIGLLGGASPEDNDPLLLAFTRGLAEAGYVEGKNLAIEYRWARGQYNLLGEMAADLAGYAPNDGNCIRLKGNERVGSRVAELQAAGAERAEVTLEGLIAEASEIKNKAMARGNYSAAVSALVMKAKLSGHWLDRAENKTSNVIYHISDRPLSLEEWAEKWCK